jgi:hypothetical protein
MSQTCCDSPRFFFCDCVAVEAEGNVFVIMGCTSCGTGKATKIQVSTSANKIRLLEEEKRKKEN